MPRYIEYRRPHGFVHDLAHWQAIDPNECCLLVLSARSLYLLQNLVAYDAAFPSRYASELLSHGYHSPLEGEADYAIYTQAVELLQKEVIDMACDISTALNNIAAAVSACCGAGAAGGTAPLNCIVNLDNETMLGPDPIDVGTPGEGELPDGFSTWQEYLVYKCQAAEFIWQLERTHMQALRAFDLVALTADIVGPIIAGLAGILPAAFTPAGFVVFVASILAIGVVSLASWAWMDQMIERWDDNHHAIVCALYNSGTSVAATQALGNALEDAIQYIVFTGILEGVGEAIAELLGTAFAQLQGNGIVAPLFEAVVAVEGLEADCSDCSPYEGILVLTSFATPFNVLQIGDSMNQPAGSGADYLVTSALTSVWRGWFTPPEDVHSVRVEFEYKNHTQGASTIGPGLHRASDGAGFGSGETVVTSADWQSYLDEFNVSTLVAGTQYYLEIDCAFGKDAEIRKIRLTALS